jgi:hypothetical protein
MNAANNYEHPGVFTIINDVAGYPFTIGKLESKGRVLLDHKRCNSLLVDRLKLYSVS